VLRVDVTSAQEMFDATMGVAPDADIVICTAAVADFRPAHAGDRKLSKTELGQTWELERNPDILATLGERYGVGQEGGPIIVGFAAQTHDVLELGREKMLKKKAHALVANKVGGPDSSFGADESSAYVITPDAHRELPRAPKSALARQILEFVAHDVGVQ
jgi:phosphopantothenoylcysteine decarboxylase/phosphopantothenate--cysteine ligase